MTNSVRELRDSAAFLVIGSNTTEAHPVVGYNIKQAVRQGARLVVADPRRIELAERADVWLRHRPGTDLALINGLCHLIIREGLHDTEYIENRTEGYDEFVAALEPFTPEYVALTAGVDAGDLRRAARILGENSPMAIVYAMGITQHVHGTQNVLALANLGMLTGNVGIHGGGVNPLRGQNNVQGACDVGGLPDVFPGYQKVFDDDARAKFEEAWGTKLSREVGLTVGEIMDAAVAGSVRAIYIMGENPMLSDPDQRHTREALEQVDFLVVQDIFMTETAELADVVLPAASFAEKDGTGASLWNWPAGWATSGTTGRYPTSWTSLPDSPRSTPEWHTTAWRMAGCNGRYRAVSTPARRISTGAGSRGAWGSSRPSTTCRQPRSPTRSIPSFSPRVGYCSIITLVQ